MIFSKVCNSGVQLQLWQDIDVLSDVRVAREQMEIDECNRDRRSSGVMPNSTNVRAAKKCPFRNMFAAFYLKNENRNIQEGEWLPLRILNRFQGRFSLKPG